MIARLPQRLLVSGVFGIESFCMSEMGGSVYNADVASGVQRWVYQPQADSHITNMWYDADEGCFYAIEWEYEHGTGALLLRLTEASGDVQVLAHLSSPVGDVCFANKSFVAGDGAVLSLRDGTIVSRIDFGPGV